MLFYYDYWNSLDYIKEGVEAVGCFLILRGYLYWLFFLIEIYVYYKKNLGKGTKEKNKIHLLSWLEKSSYGWSFGYCILNGKFLLKLCKIVLIIVLAKCCSFIL